MRRLALLLISVIFAVAAFSSAQTSDQTPLLNPTAHKPVQVAPVDPYKAALDRLESFSTFALPEWRWHSDIPHPEDSTVSDSDWQVMVPDPKAETSVWKSGTRVFRRMVEIPATVNGYSIAGARVRFDHFYNSPEALMITVFVNGNMVWRGDDDSQVPITIADNAQPGQKFNVAVRVYAPEGRQARLTRSRLIFEANASRPDPAMIRTEILAARPMIAAFPESKAEHEKILNDALNAIDFNALEKGDQQKFDASLRKTQSTLQTLNPWLKTFTIRATGNSHIDMAWLWPWTETVEVVRNTFTSALDLMREYPDLTFTMSSARTYSWMEEKYPDLFKQIQQRVKEGRWEIVGGMWVEPDLNLPAGESLVRQVLIGKLYFKQKFDVDVKIGWNPDSFGYNWQLPQIYKKSGMDYFVTQKIYWNDTTKVTHKLFWWQSPDGSRLLTYFPHDYANDTNPVRMESDLAMYAPAIYGSALKPNDEMMHLFGVGDHGGGPTREQIDVALKWSAPDAVFPKIKFGTAKEFFDGVNARLSELTVPTINNELYFEYHRGVQTTQAQTKRRIRRAEEMMLDAEQYASLAMLAGRPYPAEDMDLAWKNLLFDHFHDIMPGSGIAVNYLDAKRNLDDVMLVAHGVLHESKALLAESINTKGPGTPVIVWNTLSWPRKEVVEIDAQLPSGTPGVRVVEDRNKTLPSSLIAKDRHTNRVRIQTLVDVPANGYKIVYLQPFERPVQNETDIINAVGVKIADNKLENEFLRVIVDHTSGCITSLFDKKANTEALAPAETDTGGPKDLICGNLLQAFRDKPKNWDAWNIDADFEKEMWNIDKADSVELVEKSPLRSVIRVKKHFQNSQFVQDIILYAGMPRVDVKMHADWHEKHILLKVAFPLSAHNNKATFEIPYGSIERPTTRNTPAEQAQFEVPSQRWADISDATHGFSLLNDSKYGYDAKGNVLRLSLLRSPEWPDPHADEGPHDFIYSLYPHSGSWRDALTPRRGYEVNVPLFTMPVMAHDGANPAEMSYFHAVNDNVIVTALKKAEDSDALILRFYEWAGKEGDVQIVLPAGAQSAADADLQEKAVTELVVKDNTVAVHTKPYEIKTVLVRYAVKTADTGMHMH